MTQHRNTVTIPLRLSDHPIMQRCSDDKSYRIMVFCANDDSGLQDVAFPHQSELRVNGDEIKANLRGLKNKPGSTRPVDVTSALRLRSNYMNNIEFTYALTNKVSNSNRPYTSYPGLDIISLIIALLTCLCLAEILSCCKPLQDNISNRTSGNNIQP